MASSPTESMEGSNLLDGINGILHKPLYTPDPSTDVPAKTPDSSTAHSLLFYCVLAVFGYLLVGVVAYTLLAGMSPLDALYFCVVTLTTVGYGDLSAHKTTTKLFACLYILVGVALIGALLAKLVEIILDQQEALLVKLLVEREEDSRSQASAEPSGHVGITVNDVGASSVIKPENLKVATGMFWFLVLVVTGTAVFKFSGDMSVIDALYLTVVSASTVGYGDFHPETVATKMFAIFFLPVATLLLAKIISDYTEMRVEAQTEARQKRILLATVTVQDYRNMDVDRDGRVSPFEFLSRTLVAQEKVDQGDIDEVMARFNELDEDGSGFVELDEIGHA